MDETQQSKGGRARAEKLSPEERRRIAAEAAKARWGDGVLKATHGSADRPLRIGEAEIPCYVLADGRRVLSLGGTVKALGMSIGSAGRRQGDRLVQFAEGLRLKPFFSNDLLTRMKTPIRFQAPTGGTVATGYEATILPDICDAVLSAREASSLRADQLHIAKQCEILVRAFAKVGIVALVDEATGYQEVRSRKALEEIVNRYITEELRKWTKTFPDDYFKEMFRLRGWSLDHNTGKRPGAAGHYTNDIIYARLAPGVLDELRRLNPSDGHGRRKNKHFQFLTDDFGHPKLKEHITGVVFMMRGCRTWEQFHRLLNQSAPRINTNFELPLPEPDAA